MGRQRILGFDLARAYAILGMYFVNFNIVFGSYTDQSLLGRFLSLFNGNSSTIFVILAGMGVALMTNRDEYTNEEKNQLRSIIVKRSWFLFFAGLLLYNWWPADILHFYGGYLHIAALMLFVSRRFYLWAAGSGILVFHILLAIIPYESGWNFNKLEYIDFWTPLGFLRNTFYNGWSPIFPWIAFFFLGMWLGRLDWQNPKVKRNILLTGIAIFASIETLQIIAPHLLSPDLAFYITADYIPPFLPFMLGTSGFALIAIYICIFIGEKFADRPLLDWLSKTGQMTLTHYVGHLTIGVILLAMITGKMELPALNSEHPVSPFFILTFSIAFFVLSIIFSVYWSRRFKNGPLESLMRKVSG